MESKSSKGKEDVFSVMEYFNMGDGDITPAQISRAPDEFQSTQKYHLTTGGSNIELGGDVEIRLKKNNLLGQEYWLEFTFAAAAGAANPGYVPTYHFVRDIELQYGNKFIERWYPHHLWYENNFFSDQSDVVQSQALHNDGLYTGQNVAGTVYYPIVAATDQAVVNNATTGRKYYLKIPFVANKFIHYPTSCYNSDWMFLIRLEDLNRIVVGTDATC